MICHAIDGPPKIGPPGSSMAIFVAMDGPLDQVWLPQMIPLDLDHLQYHRWSPLPQMVPHLKTFWKATDIILCSQLHPHTVQRTTEIATNRKEPIYSDLTDCCSHGKRPYKGIQLHRTYITAIYHYSQLVTYNCYSYTYIGLIQCFMSARWC